MHLTSVACILLGVVSSDGVLYSSGYLGNRRLRRSAEKVRTEFVNAVIATFINEMHGGRVSSSQIFSLDMSLWHPVHHIHIIQVFYE